MLGDIRFDVDSTTYVLLAVAGGLYALRWALFWKPDPLVHPLILGRQAEPSPVRHSGESPVWMNGLSIGRGVVSRPDATSRTVGDLVGKGDAALRGRADALAQGLGRLLPKGGSGEPRTIAVALPHAEGASTFLRRRPDPAQRRCISSRPSRSSRQRARPCSRRRKCREKRRRPSRKRSRRSRRSSRHLSSSARS